MKSIWEANLEIEQKSALRGDIEVQTVVIGAGMAGLLTAYFLKKMGHKVIVIEAKTIASGQTKGTTAKITSQHGLFYDKIIRKIGREKARAYALANEEAISMYERIIKEENIFCHFKKRPAYLYSVQESGRAKLLKEAAVAASLGINAHFVEGKDITELPFEISGAVCFENQAQFHPLEFCKRLAAGLEIYENTKVLSVKKHMIFTNKGTIKAENIVFATHYPFVNVPGFYFLRQHQERSYVLALEAQQELTGMYYGIDKGGLSLRSVGSTLLLGGGAHRTGKNKCKSELGENKSTGYTYLRKMAQIYYPNAEEAVVWSAQDCMPHDEIPFIGKYSVIRPYWYVATGFKKWGMTSSMIAAIMISNQICGASEGKNMQYKNINPYIFTPQRMLLRAAFVNLMKDVGESILGLSKGLFSKKERRCPHMGCRLEWNAQDDRWDCPCHGSGFSREGDLQDNPAQIDLRKKS